MKHEVEIEPTSWGWWLRVTWQGQEIAAATFRSLPALLEALPGLAWRTGQKAE